MGLLEDTITIYEREMLIFKSNLTFNLLRSIVLPLIIIIFFGNFTNNFRNFPISIVNYANNPQSYAFINDLQSSQQLQIIALTNEQQALNLLAFGTVQVVVVILPNFPSTAQNVTSIQVYYSDLYGTAIATVIPEITGYANNFLPSSNSTSSNSAKNSVVSSSVLYFVNGGSYINYLVGGLISLVVAVGAVFGCGITLLSDKQIGTLKTLLATPISKNSIIMGKILSGITQSVAFGFVALLIGIIFGASIVLEPLTLVYIFLATFLLGIGFSCIGIIIATSKITMDTYSILGITVILPTWIIAGSVISSYFLPSWLSPIVALDPIAYSNDLIRTVLQEGTVTFSQSVVDFSALLIFVIIMLALATRRFKSTIE